MWGRAKKNKARELAPDHAAVVAKMREYTKRLAAIDKPPAKSVPAWDTSSTREHAALAVFGDIQALSDAARMVVYQGADQEVEREQETKRRWAALDKRMRALKW